MYSTPRQHNIKLSMYDCFVLIFHLLYSYNKIPPCRFLQISQLESEMETKWQEKSKQLVNQSERKWQRKYDDLVEESETLKKTLSESEEKVCSFLCLLKSISCFIAL